MFAVSTDYIYTWLALVGGLDHFSFFHVSGMSSSQLTFTPSFLRGIGLNHQPAISIPLISHMYPIRFPTRCEIPILGHVFWFRWPGSLKHPFGSPTKYPQVLSWGILGIFPLKGWCKDAKWHQLVFIFIKKKHGWSWMVMDGLLKNIYLSWIVS